ncbi:MAG: PGPGW domain-containing protein [Pseudomonadota bacterium]
MQRIPSSFRKWLVFAVGTVMLIIGLAMVILPGPAILMIPAALAVLATEFSFAQRWLGHARRGLSTASYRRRDSAVERHRSRNG